MRILFIAQNIPYPPTDGGKIVVYNTLRSVAEAGHEVAIVGLTQPERPTPAIFRERFPTWEFTARLGNSWLGLLNGFFSAIPYNYKKCQPRGFSDIVIRAAEEFRPQVIQVDFLHVGIYGLAASRRLRVPVILRAHNVDSRLMARFRDHEANPLVKTYAALQVSRLVRYERAFLSQFDRCVAITRPDAEELSRIGGRVVDYIPAGVSVDDFRSDALEDEPTSIVTVALMNWLPNVVSTRWLIGSVMPLVWQHEPGARLFVVGKDPPSSIRRSHDGRKVVVTGFVSDVKPWMARAGVYAVPTRVGSGMRIKVLEALAMGKAVVSTRIGCEGIEGLIDGVNVLLADSAEDFASAIVTLMREPDLRARLGSAGKNLVAERYRWEDVARRFTALYVDVVTNPRREAAMWRGGDSSR
jgi:glycosyltransferase involved in cell wall biosynthesis